MRRTQADPETVAETRSMHEKRCKLVVMHPRSVLTLTKRFRVNLRSKTLAKIKTGSFRGPPEKASWTPWVSADPRLRITALEVE